MRRTLMIAAALAAALPLAVTAQGNPPRPGRRGAMQQQPRPDSARPNRAALEAQVRQRFAQMLRNRLGLTDAQMQKVSEINTKYAGRRRTLLEQERDIRMSLREEIVAGDSTRQRQVSDLLDRMMKAQRQRIDVMEAEQHELAGVLTPLQRAQYIGMEEQIRQRVEGMRGQGGRMGPGGPPGPNGDGAQQGPGALRGRRGGPPADPSAPAPQRAPPGQPPAVQPPGAS